MHLRVKFSRERERERETLNTWVCVENELSLTRADKKELTKASAPPALKTLTDPQPCAAAA